MIEYQLSKVCLKFGIPYPNDNPCPCLAEGGWIDDTPFSFCYADDKSNIYDVVILITAHSEYTGGLYWRIEPEI